MGSDDGHKINLGNVWGDGSGTEPKSGHAMHPVSLALVVDVSTSIDDADYTVQREGTALAIRNVAPDLLQMFEDGTPVVMSYLEFAGESQIRIPPTILRDAEDIEAFAQRVEAMERTPLDGFTAVSEALRAGNDIHAQVEAQFGPLYRKVTDISADGYGSHPSRHTQAELYGEYEADEVAAILEQRDIALANGVEVNGIVMPDYKVGVYRALKAGDPRVEALRDPESGALDEQDIARIKETMPDLFEGPDSSIAVNESFYDQYVVTGFTMRANSAEEYGETLERKLRAELLSQNEGGAQPDLKTDATVSMVVRPT